MSVVRSAINKKDLALKLGVSRSSLYYVHKRPAIDEEVKTQIESVLTDHPSYGHKRIALQLKLNKKRILRVMKKFDMKPYRRKAKRPIKRNDLGRTETGFKNLLKTTPEKDLNQSGFVWVTDFTYIKFQSRFIYLATVMDRATREIVGVNISRFHNRFLVMGAYLKARDKYLSPKIIHSDQGSEYSSQDFIDLVKSEGVEISMSIKGSPWQNGHQESFFGHIKDESGDLNRFETVGELLEEIYQMIYYYNNERIHTKLKMTPKQYYLKLQKSEIKSKS